MKLEAGGGSLRHHGGLAERGVEYSVKLEAGGGSLRHHGGLAERGIWCSVGADQRIDRAWRRQRG